MLHFIQMTPDFEDPPSTVINTFSIDVDAFSLPPSGAVQPGAFPALEVLPFPMYTPNYRNFGDHDALVFTHDVDAGGVVGRRWYEIRSPLGEPEIYQQSTFAPDDGLNRWMGSAAFDYSGNIAMGYSVSSTRAVPVDLVHRPPRGRPPQRNVAGREHHHRGNRLPGRRRRPVGRLQLDGHRSDRSVHLLVHDRVHRDDRTGHLADPDRLLQVPSCSIGPTGSIHGTVTDGTNPIAGVKVTAGSASTMTSASGAYTIHAARRQLSV